MRRYAELGRPFLERGGLDRAVDDVAVDTTGELPIGDFEAIGAPPVDPEPRRDVVEDLVEPPDTTPTTPPRSWTAAVRSRTPGVGSIRARTRSNAETGTP